MYGKKYPTSTSIKINPSREGITIEKRVQRLLNNKEPITDATPLVFSDRKDGVQPEYDIRTDKFDMMIDAKNQLADKWRKNRDERHKPKEKSIGEQAQDGIKKEGGTQSAAGTESK